MDYTFKMLRNSEPVASKAVAVALLDAYEYHLVGQPLAIRYYKDEAHTNVQVLFAIGIKNHNDIADNDSPNHGRDFYRLIGGESGDIQWELYENGQLNKSGDAFRIAYMTPEEFDEWSVYQLPNVMSLVYDAKNDIGRIYKGNVLYGTTNLTEMNVSESFTTDNGIEINSGDSFQEVINKVANSSGVKWGTFCKKN